MVTEFNIYNSVAYLLTGIVSALISVLSLLKNPNKRLNQLFSTGYLCWSTSMISNGLVFLLAYPSLVVANVFRDFCVILGILGVMILFLATYGLYFGETSLNWIAIGIFSTIGLSLSLVGVFNDSVIPDDELGGYKTYDNIVGKVTIQIAPALFIIAAIILLFLTSRALTDTLTSKRVRWYAFGFLSIILGHLLFLVDAFISISPYILPSIAHICWILGPALMLLSFYIKPEVNSSSPSLSEQKWLQENKQIPAQQQQ
jgi:hypothetical protein